MYIVSADYKEGLRYNYLPVIVAAVSTFTRTLILSKEAHAMPMESAYYLWDGTRAVGDGGTYGFTMPIEQVLPVVSSFGSIEDTLTPQGNDLLTSLTQTEIGSVSVTCDNNDMAFHTLQGDDRGGSVLLGMLRLYQGFRDVDFSEFTLIFSGEIQQLSLSERRFRILAEAL